MFCLHAMHQQPHGLAWIRMHFVQACEGFHERRVRLTEARRARAQEQDALFVVGTEEGFLCARKARAPHASCRGGSAPARRSRTTSSSWAPRRASCTSAARRSTRSMWPATRGTTARSTRSRGTGATAASSSPRPPTGPSGSGTMRGPRRARPPRGRWRGHSCCTHDILYSSHCPRSVITREHNLGQSKCGLLPLKWSTVL